MKLLKVKTSDFGPLTSHRRNCDCCDRLDPPLSIVWDIEYFLLFVYSPPFKLITDHKPLQCIYGNPQSKQPVRIECWLLWLQQYEFTVKYKQGAENPADYLTRHPVVQPTSENYAELYLDTLTKHSVPKSIRGNYFSKQWRQNITRGKTSNYTR